MMRTLENFWTALAFASIIAFIVINVFVAKKYDIYREKPPALLPIPPDFKAFNSHVEGCEICNGPVTDQGPPGLCQEGFELMKADMLNDKFVFHARDGWTYIGDAIPGWYWSVAKQEWLKK